MKNMKILLSHLQNQTKYNREMDKKLQLPFYNNGDHVITKKYRDITLVAILAKTYNALLLNRIQPEIEKILRKNQSVFLEKAIHVFTDSE